jgi:hypothetical protein
MTAREKQVPDADEREARVSTKFGLPKQQFGDKETEGDSCGRESPAKPQRRGMHDQGRTGWART